MTTMPMTTTQREFIATSSFDRPFPRSGHCDARPLDRLLPLEPSIDGAIGRVEVGPDELLPAIDDHGGVATRAVPGGLPEPFDRRHVHDRHPDAAGVTLEERVHPVGDPLEVLEE